MVKSLALSKLTFVDFIWSHKDPKIKKTTMIGEKKRWDKDVPDFDIVNKSLKAVWVKRPSTTECVM